MKRNSIFWYLHGSNHFTLRLRFRTCADRNLHVYRLQCRTNICLHMLVVCLCVIIVHSCRRIQYILSVNCLVELLMTIALRNTAYRIDSVFVWQNSDEIRLCWGHCLRSEFFPRCIRTNICSDFAFTRYRTNICLVATLISNWHCSYSILL